MQKERLTEELKSCEEKILAAGQQIPTEKKAAGGRKRKEMALVKGWTFTHLKVNISTVSSGSSVTVIMMTDETVIGTIGSNSTAAPILFLSNVLDPVAPIEGARQRHCAVFLRVHAAVGKATHCGFSEKTVRAPRYQGIPSVHEALRLLHEKPYCWQFR